MKRILILLTLILIFFQTAKAQKRDTLLYYMNDQNQIVNDKKQADYFLLIMPPDSSSGVKLYPVNEYYANGKPKLAGLSRTKNYQEFDFDGPCISFYPNGKRQSVFTYSGGFKQGDAVLYYPNGKVYANESFTADGKCYLIECRDSLGNILTTNGVGKWVEYNYYNNSEIEEGAVQDSLREGQWTGTDAANKQYVIVYHHGKVISVTGGYRYGDNLIFTAVEKMPGFVGGQLAMDDFIAKSINYPVSAERQDIQGSVYIQCIVEKDGTLTDLKIFRSPDNSLSEEAIRVVKSMPPWIPGRQNGLRVRVYHVIRVKFALNNN